MIKGLLRNLAKFTGKHLCQSLFFNKVADLAFIKKETLTQVFSCEFCEISKKSFRTEDLSGRPLLNISRSKGNQAMKFGQLTKS